MLHFVNWHSAWLILLLILGFGLLVGKLTEKPKIPDVAAYLFLGIALGPMAANWISEPNQSEVNQFILNLGATFIVFDGGQSVKLSILRQVWMSVTLLATVGVVITAAVVAFAAHVLIGAPWMVCFLLASVIASTDPATLIPVFKRVSIEERLQQAVESESAFNDATAAVLVFTLMKLTTGGGTFSLASTVVQFVHSSVIGMVTGLLVGLLTLWFVSLRGWGVLHEFGSIAMFVAALGSFQAAEFFGGSGLMAAFATGIVTGNGQSFRLPLAGHTVANIHHFGNAITLVLRMLIFVLLGTQVEFDVVKSHFAEGLVLVLVLMFLARPLTVLISASWDRRAKWTYRELLFMCWTRETGVIPAALSGMMKAEGIPGADLVGAVTFLAILITILLQASTTSLVAKWLGLLREVPTEDI
jgi:potassium/hydrogen antiporter